jgi:MtrB/PioB family decaheme-associated outer membrane protein
MLVAAALLILPGGTKIFAAEDSYLSGSVEVGGQINDGADEGANFQKYRDLSDAVFGDFLIDYYKENYFLRAEGENAGLEDQSYELKGGKYQRFKFSVFYDELPHNLSFNTRSFYSGIGSDNLVIDTAGPFDPSTWREFDYSIDTTTYGGNIEFALADPYFLTIGLDRAEKDGLKPLGSGSFSGAVEMPEPVDYATNNLIIKGGYRTDTMSFKLDGLYSSFTNDNNYLDWQNPFLGITEHNSLPPDNDFGKIGADFSWRQLPWMSTLVIRGSYTNLTSETSVDQVGGPIPVGLNTNTFDGEISTTRLSATYLSHPRDALDTKLYYSYYDRDNDSTIIEYQGGGNDTHLFAYSKHNLGVEADYRLSSANKLSGGYDYKNVDRTNRPDGDNTSDNTLFLELKNSSIENVVATFGYSYLNRDTDTNFDLTDLTPADGAYITQFISRYDVASKSKHDLELALEFYPLNSLDFGLSYNYINNDYDDVVLGRTEDSGHELYGDVMWRATSGLNLSAFIGYENYEADSNHYNHRAGFQGQKADPTVEDGSPASFVWAQSMNTAFWTFGLMAEMGFMQDRLKASLAFQYQDSDGDSDISAPGETFTPIDPFEDYEITTLELKGVYALTRTIDMSLGYIYEKSTYKDLQYLGYEYTPPGTLLSGAYSDHDYEAHVGYLTVRYNF